MSKEFKCRWPTGIETLRVRPGHLSCDTLAVSMRLGQGVGGSVHLSPDDAIEVAQALAVGRAKLLPARNTAYRCEFFKGLLVSAEPHTDDCGEETVAIEVGQGLGYLSKADAKALAMDLLAITAD